MPCAPRPLEVRDRVDDLPRVVAAGAGQHHRPALDLVDDQLDDATLLVCGQRRRFARGAAGHQEVNARLDLPRASRVTAASSTAPFFVNGVISAVPRPVNESPHEPTS